MLRKPLLALSLLLALPAVAGAQGLVINPQVGLTASRLTSDPVLLKDEARIGYGIGGFLRLGQGHVYLQPGAFYQQTSLKLTLLGSTRPSDVKDNVSVNSIYIPVLAGFNVVDSEFFVLRLNAGGSGTITTSVSDNEFGITKDDYKSVVWGAVAGIGADISTITVDVSGEFGLSKVFKSAQAGFADADSKQGVIRANAGIKF